jgi:hypothetical protein
MLFRSMAVTAALAALTGCSTISSSLGLERHIPDETQVTVRPALTLPPDFNLVPPGTETAVSGDHETANPNATVDASGAAPKKEERGFFGSLFHGDFFGNDVDATTAKEHAAQASAPDVNGTPQAPAPDVNGTPQAPAPTPPAAAAPPSDATPATDAAPAPAPAPKKDEPGFFGRLFGSIF